MQIELWNGKSLVVNQETGIASVLNSAAGVRHSAHPNIHGSGSVQAMIDCGYWGEDDVIVESDGFYYNTSMYLVSDELDEIANNNCKCGGKHRPHR